MVSLQTIDRTDSVVFQRLRRTLPGDTRLDSGTSHGPWARWSYMTDAPTLILTAPCDGSGATLSDSTGVIQQWADPLDALSWMEQYNRCAPLEGPGFKGGWVGYLSYDLGRLFEIVPARARDDLHAPLFQFTYHPRVWCFDVANDACVCAHVRTAHSTPLARREPEPPGRGPSGVQRLDRTFSRGAYVRCVERAIEYIRAGDIFQVNLAQRFGAPFTTSTPELYDRLRLAAPGSFGAFLGFAEPTIVSNSPELFLRVTSDPRTGERHVVTRPIKGTRPLVPGADIELRDSEKDQAELHMIVDLERNDLGRVCEIGSVRVSESRTIERHPTVYHGVATIEGRLRSDVGLVDLLRATFPGGSITGAPKIRAMQIIDELEPVRRGPYCGAIGYLSVDGHMEFNIAIRTMVISRGRVHVSVGGGIVADSDPESEYVETLVKAKAMFEALGVTENDLVEFTCE